MLPCSLYCVTQPWLAGRARGQHLPGNGSLHGFAPLSLLRSECSQELRVQRLGALAEQQACHLAQNLC